MQEMILRITDLSTTLLGAVMQMMAGESRVSFLSGAPLVVLLVIDSSPIKVV
jgi:hypothetical protein